MSQRDSGYVRKERDLYETPEWVTLALAPHIPEYVGWILEPAAGGGKMVRALQGLGHTVEATDVETGFDFMDCGRVRHDAIITNPPYVLAEEFITHALDLMQHNAGFVAMLLRTDYDHARTRSHLFAGHRAFSKKVVLTKRIQWFEDSKGSPSFNHAWFIWDWTHEGAPTLAYGPAVAPHNCQREGHDD
jgi:hypothetical protein